MTKGNYLLIMFLPKAKDIAIGKKITHVFKRGYYLYTGSAYGPGGIEKRLERHFRADKKMHWHIDYFLKEAKLLEAWYINPAISLEHVIAEQLLTSKTFQPAFPRFGSSDCNCETHLFYSKLKPKLKELQSILTSIESSLTFRKFIPYEQNFINPT